MPVADNTDSPPKWEHRPSVAADIADYRFVFVTGKADIDTPPNTATWL